VVDVDGASLANRELVRASIESGNTTLVMDWPQPMSELLELSDVGFIARVDWDTAVADAGELARDARTVGLIVRIDADKISPQEIEPTVLHRFQLYRLPLSAQVRFSRIPSPVELDSWLTVFEELPIAGLCFDVDDGRCSTTAANPYVSIVIAHSELIERTRAQIRFLTQFRPAHCSYLDDSGRVTVLRNGRFAVCPRHRADGDAEDDIEVARDRITERVHRLQQRRLVDYATAGRPFTCTACVAEGADR
jgi:hypothetical protein